MTFQSQAGQSLLVIQCDSGHLSGDLIACARYRVSDIRMNAAHRNTHVLFIVHLPRKVPTSSFVAFQGDPWICAHVDNLFSDNYTLSLHTALKLSISELFYNLEFVSDSNSPSFVPESSLNTSATSDHLQRPLLCQRLNGCIHAAASRLYDVESDQKRTTERVDLLKVLIPEYQERQFPLGKTDKNTCMHALSKLYTHKLVHCEICSTNSQTNDHTCMHEYV